MTEQEGLKFNEDPPMAIAPTIDQAIDELEKLKEKPDTVEEDPREDN